MRHLYFWSSNNNRIPLPVTFPSCLPYLQGRWYQVWINTKRDPRLFPQSFWFRNTNIYTQVTHAAEVAVKIYLSKLFLREKFIIKLNFLAIYKTTIVYFYHHLLFKLNRRHSKIAKTVVWNLHSHKNWNDAAKNSFLLKNGISGEEK